jgi:uncharacterized protein YdhG (YjbR/CyaY superfamily)
MGEEQEAAIDSDLKTVPEPARSALTKLRAQIKSAAPQAEEALSYGVPAFKQGRSLVSYGAAKSHCSFFVQSPAVMEQLADELEGYDTAKGTIRFQPEKPLPASLVKKIVKARLAENAALDTKRKTKPKA